MILITLLFFSEFMIPNNSNCLAMSDLPSLPLQLAEKIFDTGLFADLILELKTDNNEVRELRVHRGILAKISHVWFQCIQNDGNTGRLTIEEFSYDTIKHLLYFCYTGYVTFESLIIHIEVLQAADHYCMSSLIEYSTKLLCSSIVHSILNIKDFLLIFEYAAKYQNAVIIDYCMAYLEENPKFLFEYAEYSNLSLNLILTILKSKHYISTEFELLCFVFCWIRETVKSLSQTLDDYIVKSTIIQHLYLNRLSLEELRQLYLNFQKDLPGLFWLNINIFAKVDLPPCLQICQDSMVRGGENENMLTEIIVRKPPMTIKEKFFVSNLFMLESIKIVQRINSLGVQMSVNHMEHISINIEDVRSSTMSIREIVPNASALVIKPTTSIPVSPPDTGFITFLITFFRPGVYKKNYDFSYQSQKFYRPDNGVISQINIYDSE